VVTPWAPAEPATHIDRTVAAARASDMRTNQRIVESLLGKDRPGKWMLIEAG
jgi:hypothetical protein